MEATNNASKANDYATAYTMSKEIYSTFVVVYLGDSMGLLVDELQKIYQRNTELQAIKPDPLWKRFDVLKNHTSEIFDYINDTEDWGLEHNAKVEKLSRFTIDPDFYKLAIERLAQEENEVIEKNNTKTLAHDRAIKKAETSITNLRRMRYSGEVDDDSWYFAEMQCLEDELERLQESRNQDEYKARNWRAVADETFTLARYAKEDFDGGDDLEKKRSVVMKLGEKLTILDRTIQFTPNKYFVPLEKNE